MLARAVAIDLIENSKMARKRLYTSVRGILNLSKDGTS